MSTDLTYFQETNYAGETTFKQPVISHKNEGDLKDLIAQNVKQSAIEGHADLIAQAEQWTWLKSYQEHQIAIAVLEQYNANLPIIGLDESEEPILSEPKELPILKPRPVLRTGKDILDSLNYYTDKFKAERSIAVESIKVTVDDMEFDGDETSQTRMARAILGMKEADILATKWKLADNTVVDVSVKQLAKVMLIAGQEQTGLWGME